MISKFVLLIENYREYKNDYNNYFGIKGVLLIENYGEYKN